MSTQNQTDQTEPSNAGATASDMAPDLAPRDPERRARAVKQLQMAENFIRSYGWIQGDFGSKDRGACTYGAIAKTLPRKSDGSSTITDRVAFADAIDCFYRSGVIAGYDSIAQWNDARGRTKDQVLEAFAKAKSWALTDPELF